MIISHFNLPEINKSYSSFSKSQYNTKITEVLVEIIERKE